MATAQLRAVLRGDSSQFRGEINRAGASVNQFKGLAQSIGPQLASVFAVGVVARFSESVINAGGRVFDMSEQLGITTDQFQQFDYAAKQVGSDVETMVKAIQKGQLNVAEAARGVSTYKVALDRLGLSTEQLTGLAPQEFLLRVADAFRNSSDQASAANGVLQLFGQRAASLIPLLKQGREGIDALFAGAPVTNSETIKNLKALSDQLTLLKAQFAPIAAEAVNAFSKVSQAVLATLFAAGAGLAALASMPFVGFQKSAEALDAALSDFGKKLFPKPPELTPVKLGESGAEDKAGLEKQAKLREQILALVRDRKNLDASNVELLGQMNDRIFEQTAAMNAAPDESSRLEAQKELEKLLLARARLEKQIADEVQRQDESLAQLRQQLAAAEEANALRKMSREEQILALKQKQVALLREAAALEAAGDLEGALKLKIEAENITGRLDSLANTPRQSADSIQVIASDLARVGAVGQGSAVLAIQRNETVAVIKEGNAILKDVKKGVDDVRKEIRDLGTKINGGTYG